MMRQILHAKISYATVTEAQLYYEGSITIDSAIIEKAGIVPGEKVEVLNMNNGERFETYVIAGEKNTGVICLNGPAARKGLVGDKLIILSYVFCTQEEIKNVEQRIVLLDEKNKIKDTLIR